MNHNSTVSLRDVVRVIKDRDIRFIDLKFTDLFGSLQHISYPVEAFKEDMFTHGMGFDGSSIRGFQRIHESDMLIKPDPDTMFVDPFMDDATISFFCNIKDPANQQIYTRDSRAVAQRAERYLTASGLADSASFGPELEFFIFDHVRFHQTTNEGFYHIDSEEGNWNSGRSEGGNLGHRPRQKGGYFPAPPVDSYQNLRSKMVSVLMESGIEVEVHHHEVGSGGQAEIGIRFNTLTAMADRALKYKYVIKNVAHRYGKTVTFMPKPLFQDNGSGMHVHVSLWREGKNLFHQTGGYADLSPMALSFIAGILRHAPALCAFCAPTTNSYRRLVPGYEAPINLVFSRRNRSACVRIPMVGNPKATRIEFRTPDPSSNPYLAFSAILMAGLDGVRKNMAPSAPVDEDIYEMADTSSIQNTPGSLEASINALEDDHQFLLEGGVFTNDLVETYIAYKRQNEVDHVRLRPHPSEFYLYYDV